MKYIATFLCLFKSSFCRSIVGENGKLVAGTRFSSEKSFSLSPGFFPDTSSFFPKVFLLLLKKRWGPTVQNSSTNARAIFHFFCLFLYIHANHMHVSLLLEWAVVVLIILMLDVSIHVSLFFSVSESTFCFFRRSAHRGAHYSVTQLSANIRELLVPI